MISTQVCTTVDDLCAGYPEEFSELLNAMRNLQFFQTPDYEELRNILRALMVKNNWQYDGRY